MATRECFLLKVSHEPPLKPAIGSTQQKFSSELGSCHAISRGSFSLTRVFMIFCCEQNNGQLGHR